MTHLDVADDDIDRAIELVPEASGAVRPPARSTERLDRIVATAQAEQRAPSVSAAVFRDGDVLWRRALGSADVDRGEDATTEHAYRIGSITKTFTAVCILQLRDARVLDLDDPLRNHVPEAPPARPWPTRSRT